MASSPHMEKATPKCEFRRACRPSIGRGAMKAEGDRTWRRRDDLIRQAANNAQEEVTRTGRPVAAVASQLRSQRSVECKGQGK